MCEITQLNQIAIAIGNQHRLAMLVLMMEGRYFTAKELAYGAGIQPSAATGHLKTLVASKMVKSFSQGKFKYFTLYSADVASVIESVICLAATKEIRRSKPDAAMCHARLCFNHLAGRLGINIYRFMDEMKFITSDNDSKILRVTGEGKNWLRRNHFNCNALFQSETKQAIQCMDWSERIPHLGGKLGSIIAVNFMNSGWIRRKKNSRAVIITEEGYENISRLFNIHMKNKRE